MPNAIEPYFSLLGPILLLESFPQNRQITTEALNIASRVSSADARTEELSVVAEPKNEAAQKSTETARLAIETLIAAFLHFCLSIISKTVSCFFSPLSSVVNDTHGEFSKTLSFTAAFNSALKLAANLGELGVDQLSWTSQTAFLEENEKVLPLSVSCFSNADFPTMPLRCNESSQLLKMGTLWSYLEYH